MCRQEGHQFPTHSGKASEEAISVGTGGHSLKPENTWTFPTQGPVCVYASVYLCLCVHVYVYISVCFWFCLDVCVCVL